MLNETFSVIFKHRVLTYLLYVVVVIIVLFGLFF